MHRFDHQIGGRRIVFFYNGDMTGDVEISIISRESDGCDILADDVVSTKFKIPCEALRAFVAEDVRRRIISYYEGMDASSLLMTLAAAHASK